MEAITQKSKTKLSIELNTPQDLEKIVAHEYHIRLYHSLKNINFSYSSLYRYAMKNFLLENMSIKKSKAALLGELMDVSETTVYRWKNSKRNVEGKYAERLSELIQFYGYGEEVIGSKSSFVEWLKSPNIHLSDQAPVEILDSLAGMKYLKHLLDKIEYGAPV